MNNKHLTKIAEAIEIRPIGDLHPIERNPRLHSPAQITQIAASMGELGFNNPILVNAEGGIIVGHARYLAALELGLTQVPVVVLRHLDADEQRAYRIADNQLALNASWDYAALKAELDSLIEKAYKVDLLGFVDEELKRLLASPELQKTFTDEDDVPEAEVAATSLPGDLWILDGHRVLCGDATLDSSFERVLGAARAEMVFMDPPYNCKYSQTQKGKRDRSILNDNLGENFGDFLAPALRNVLASTDGAIYIAMSSAELDTLQSAFREAGGHWSTFIIWAKDNFTLGRSDYQRQFEPILYGWREGSTHHWCGARNQGDVWFFPKPKANRLHPTMKPVALVERAVSNSSRPGAIVLDPFGGSGTTLIACQKTGRQSRLIELAPEYVDVIVRRWQEFTGREATLEGDGRSFAAISEERLPKASAELVACHE